MALPSHEGKISFKFNANKKRVKIKTQNDARVVLEEGLCVVLGFHSQIVKGIEESTFVADPQAAFSVFYVYSDIVEPVVVGHVEAPLLRVVRISGDSVSAQYDRPHYVPVIRQSFHTIEIEIRFNSGDLLPFERGVSYYEGVSFQKGYGLGGIFRRLFRAALPFLVKGVKAVGKEALRTSTRVVSDVLSGENFKIAARKRSEEAGRGSPECVKLEIELFLLPATQTAIERGQWVEFQPLSNVFDGGPVEFHISGSGEEYLDLSQTQFFLKAKIVKSDGSPIEKGAEIGPVNLFLHSLFSQVDITLNERLVSNSSNFTESWNR
ncbi:uncharacterized protein F54H12.2 [Trichonephila clavipes]|nr:uncharacterized protein F54H12.2 [Trichonephila clavipes]